MDNAAKWWDTQAEAAAQREASQKFAETEIQRAKNQWQLKIRCIVGVIFFAGGWAAYQMLRRFL